MIRMIYVGSNEADRDTLQRMCRRFSELLPVEMFDNEAGVLTCIERERIQLVVINAETSGGDDLDLGRQIRQEFPDVLLVYVSSKDSHCLAAMRQAADYFLFRPVQEEAVAGFIRRRFIFYPAKQTVPHIQMFGHFDVFCEAEPIRFSNKKSKELLALCFHARGIVSLERAVAALWPDRPCDARVKRLYRKAVADLHAALEPYDRELFFNIRGKCYARTDRLVCDYYDYLRGVHYPAEECEKYLCEYAWAAETAEKLFFAATEQELRTDSPETLQMLPYFNKVFIEKNENPV